MKAFLPDKVNIVIGARWCVRGDPSGFYDLRQDDPERRVPAPLHKTPSTR